MRRALFQLSAGAIPGKRPAPVHAYLVVSVDDGLCSELMTEDLSFALHNADDEGFAFIRPVGIAYPNLVVAPARDFEVLIDLAAGFIRAGGGGVPFALTAL